MKRIGKEWSGIDWSGMEWNGVGGIDEDWTLAEVRDMTAGTRMNIWQAEYEDRWFADGHHDLNSMIAAAIELELECTGRRLVNDDFADATVSHAHVVEDPNDDERLIAVESDVAGAEPITTLCARSIDWDRAERTPP